MNGKIISELKGDLQTQQEEVEKMKQVHEMLKNIQDMQEKDAGRMRKRIDVSGLIRITILMLLFMVITASFSFKPGSIAEMICVFLKYYLALN